MPELKSITIYTDGACKGNPGPGGCAYYCVETKASGSHWFKDETTNNRMELRAILEAIRYAREIHRLKTVTIVTDSSLCIGWLSLGWKRNHQAIDSLVDSIQRVSKGLTIKYKHVKGHSGDPHNERVDRMAVLASTNDH